MKRTKIFSLLFVIILFFKLTACTHKIPQPIISIDIPKIINFSMDGDPVEWKNIESYRLWANPIGGYPDSSDLATSFKASWNTGSLVLIFDVSDDNYFTDSLYPWNGDAIEIFLSRYRGSGDILQISVIPGPENDRIRVYNPLKGNDSTFFPGEVKSFTRFNGNNRTTEVEIPFLKNEKSHGSFALQVYVNDADTDTGNQERNQVVWYPVGPSYNSSFSMFTINPVARKQTVLKASTRLVITDNEKLSLYIFGATSGTEIGIYRNGEFFDSVKTSSNATVQPDSFDITSAVWDLENDSMFITINDESQILHELFLSPRLYVNLKEQRFEVEIRNFMLQDRHSFPPENATLFIGSSSIVRWETLETDFPELNIIQRGFGGSASTDVLMYINKIVIPYKPLTIVYYEGDNDIPMGLTPEEVCNNVKVFIEQVIVTLPETQIFILSPKPSINRMQFWEKYQNTQQLLRELPERYSKVVYVDVASPMFKPDGSLDHSLFVEDGIHMNEAGYAIWVKVLRDALKL